MSTREPLDVVIIGAGLSGIGAAVHLQKRLPNKSVAVLEMRAALGGTWDLFRYPGIRSDSDMYTLGYGFKPWTRDNAVADGASIREYIRETAVEYGIERRIRYHHKVTRLNWCSAEARWHIDCDELQTGDSVAIAARFVICAAGYYKYEHGYAPHFEGEGEFGGGIIHPQLWPPDLDYTGKRIVVIGSGATAVTLVPALTDKAAHVTMLQRSPSYLGTLPARDALPRALRRVLPERAVYALTRAKYVALSTAVYRLSRAYPRAARAVLLEGVRRQLAPGFEMRHFSPRYAPWDERLCVVRDGDLFEALNAGRASIVTGRIARFSKHGVQLESGEELEADIVVTATGLEMQLLGGSELTLDGQPVRIAEKLSYKGAMLQDVPNMSIIYGYINASWTLKADLIAGFTCKVLTHMDTHGYTQCTPRNLGGTHARGPFVEMSSGYIQRALDGLPRQGDRDPWKVHQSYLRDYRTLKLSRVDDGVLSFSTPAKRTRWRGRSRWAKRRSESP